MTARHYKTIIVRWNRTPKEFDVTFDYDNGTENRNRLKVKYGYILYRATAGALKDDKYSDYELVGFDLDGNGTADVMPGDSFRVTGDMTLKAAVWKATDKIYSVVFYAMSGEFDDGTVRYEITGKYGDATPTVGYSWVIRQAQRAMSLQAGIMPFRQRSVMTTVL